MDAAHDDQRVGVALQVLDDHLYGDARNHHTAPSSRGSGLTDPAAHRMRAIKIPLEAHENAAEFVAVDPAVADHHRHLRALDNRSGAPFGAQSAVVVTGMGVNLSQ